MPATTIRISREELYKRVWSTPLREIASEYGVSDVGLAKRCRRNEIPLPPQGFHIMKSGYKKERLIKPLPPMQPQYEAVLVFQLTDKIPVSDANNINDEIRTLLSAFDGNLSPAARNTIDKILRTVKSELNPKRLDERGIIISPPNPIVRVSPAQLTRALDILKTLLTRLSYLGADIRYVAEPERGAQLQALWRNYTFRFHIEESAKRFEALQKDIKIERDGYIPYSNPWRFEPTGVLCLKYWGAGYGDHATKDGRLKLEDRLDDVVVRIAVQAAEQNAEDQLKAEREKRARAHLLEKEKVRQEQEYQERRYKRLFVEARQWRKAESLRCFINAAKSAGYAAAQSNFASEHKWQEWLVWAERYIHSLDPIAQGTVGTRPPYPEAHPIVHIPHQYLEFDDPLEAEKTMHETGYWWRRNA